MAGHRAYAEKQLAMWNTFAEITQAHFAAVIGLI
jgi:hypothetical protein